MSHQPKCSVCSCIAKLPDMFTAQGDIPRPEPLSMHCCESCGVMWCTPCLDGIDPTPAAARDCRHCHRGRVTSVHRPFVLASIPEGSRLPRCGCIRGLPVAAEQARDHELHCPRFLLFVLQSIGAVKQGATLNDPATINALNLLALAHPFP